MSSCLSFTFYFISICLYTHSDTHTQTFSVWLWSKAHCSVFSPSSYVHKPMSIWIFIHLTFLTFNCYVKMGNFFVPILKHCVLTISIGSLSVLSISIYLPYQWLRAQCCDMYILIFYICFFHLCTVIILFKTALYFIRCVDVFFRTVWVNLKAHSWLSDKGIKNNEWTLIKS